MKSSQFSENGFLIRQRSVNELFDLACLLLRKIGLPALGYSLLLFIPVFLLDQWLFLLLFGDVFAFQPFQNSQVYWYLLLLIPVINIQVNFVFSPTIIYLGAWFFHPEEKFEPGYVFRTWLTLLPQILYYFVFFALFYADNPHLRYILLLEKTPFLSNGLKMSTSKRARLFRRSGGSLAIKAKSASLLFYLLFYFAGALIIPIWIYTLLGSTPFWWAIFLVVIFPLYCWLLSFYLVIYQFLVYLHLRILREGWDLEIAFKAEFLRHEETDELAGVSQGGLYEHPEIILTAVTVQENNLRGDNSPEEVFETIDWKTDSLDSMKTEGAFDSENEDGTIKLKAVDQSGVRSDIADESDQIDLSAEDKEPIGESNFPAGNVDQINRFDGLQIEETATVESIQRERAESFEKSADTINSQQSGEATL